MNYFESEPLEELPFMEPLNNSLLPISFNNMNNIYNMEHQKNDELVVDMFLKDVGETFDNFNVNGNKQGTYATVMALSTNVDQNTVQHNEMVTFSNQLIDNQNSTNNQRVYTTLMPISSNINYNHVPNILSPVPFCQSTQIWNSNTNPIEANLSIDNQNSTNNQRTYVTLMPLSINVDQNTVQYNELNNNLLPNLSNQVACCQSTQICCSNNDSLKPLENNQTSTNIVTDSTNSISMSNQVVPLQIFDLNPVPWVFASHRISKNQNTPKICYQPNQSIISKGSTLYIYYDLYEMPYTTNIINQNQLMPRISAHRMRTSNKKFFPLKPLVEPMIFGNDGLYHFQMPPFILNKTKEYVPTLRKEWRLKYNELLEIIGNIDELQQPYSHYNANNNKNTNSNVQIDNLISKHLRNGTNIYKYVCLGIYICEKYMDENSKIRYRKIDGPFYSEKLATLEKENLVVKVPSTVPET